MSTREPTARPTRETRGRPAVGRAPTGARGDCPPPELAAGVEPIVARLAAGAEDGDTVAIFSNGAFGGIHQRVLDALGEGRA